ncbi:hypothetical protein NUSPORA_00781 [Nucleospora cyclopteri]
MFKYVLVTGESPSINDKGLLCSAVATLMQSKGYRVTFLKIDQYLNYKSGKMSPIERGEIYVLNDGTETDMYVGEFERSAIVRLTQKNTVTAGKILYDTIMEEMNGEFNGVKLNIRETIHQKLEESLMNLQTQKIDVYENGKWKRVLPEIAIISLGGSPYKMGAELFLEALQKFFSKLKTDDFCCISLDCLITIDGEEKIKGIQRNLLYMQGHGLATDILLYKCSCDHISDKSLKKLQNYASVKKDTILKFPSSKNPSKVPLMLSNEGLDEQILKLLNLEGKTPFIDLTKWRDPLKKKYEKSIKLGLITRYSPQSEAYYSLETALYCAAKEKGFSLELIRIDQTKYVENEQHFNKIIDGLNGMVCPGGFKSIGVEGKLKIIKYVRENKIPFLAICLGFQLAVIEFCQNVLDIKTATSAEFDPSSPNDVINYLKDKNNAKKVFLGKYSVKLNGFFAKLYNKKTSDEKFRHGCGLNHKYIKLLEEKGFKIEGYTNDGRASCSVLEDHPFFVGVQYHPELSFIPSIRDPLIDAFIEAMIKK